MLVCVWGGAEGRVECQWQVVVQAVVVQKKRVLVRQVPLVPRGQRLHHNERGDESIATSPGGFVLHSYTS